MAGIVLQFTKSTPRFHVYTPHRGEADGVGSLYIRRELMEYGAEAFVRVSWPEPPESGR